jgi:hypothetical protein
MDMIDGPQPLMGSTNAIIKASPWRQAIAFLAEVSASKAALAAASPAEIRQVLAVAEAEMAQPAGPAAKAAVRKIMGAYPAVDLPDPAAFLSQAVEAIEDYPLAVVNALASPKTGIVRASKFLPRVAELCEWCETQLRRCRNTLEGGRAALWEAERAEVAQRAAMEAAARGQRNPAEIEADRVRMVERIDGLLADLRKTNRGGPRKPGSTGARSAWERAMCQRLRDRPDLVEEYMQILNERPDLCDFATEEERQCGGAGWPKLSERLLEIHSERRAVAKADEPA